MGKSKLTEENRAEIRKLFKEGYSRAALAAKYDVSSQTIYRVLNPEYYAKTLTQSAEYQREHGKKIHKRRSNTYRVYHLSFHNKNDSEIIERLDNQENVHDYIRVLVANDIKKGN